MEASSQKRLSLDTNVLFDLAAGRDFAHEFRETYQGKGYSLVIAPTVVAELYFLRIDGDREERRLASVSLAKLSTWEFRPFTLSDIQTDLAKRFARRLLERGLLPEEELNDACILAESAVAEIPVVVSSDKHLLDVDQDVLRDLCDDADLTVTFPLNPRRLLRALR
jgi:predicted nucleic acid-binding protein